MIRAATYSRWSCGSGAQDPVGVSCPRAVGARAGWVLAGLLAAVAFGLSPSPAAADACDQNADDSYNSNCGPWFTVPNWGDAAGWKDPSQYSTIQLADVNGDGSDELIGRADDGIEIFWFDTTLGQWRPQLDAENRRQALTDFATPPPSDASDPHSPALPQYYSTIQAADVDGQPGAEILARFWDGMRVYKYTPPAGGSQIDDGSWSRIGTGGPFSDGDGYGDPSLYATIHVAQGAPPGRSQAVLFARTRGAPGGQSLAYYTWSNGAWSPAPGALTGFSYTDFSDQACGQPSCYLDLKQTGNLYPIPHFGPVPETIIGRNQQGASVITGLFGTSGSSRIARLRLDDTDDSSRILSDVAGTPDCPFSTSGDLLNGGADCLGSSPSYYETLQSADVDPRSGGCVPRTRPCDELLARAFDGLRVYSAVQSDSLAARGGTLTALGGSPLGDVIAPGMWGSIRTGDIDGQGGDEVLFLDRNGQGLQAWSYDPAQKAWTQLPANPSLALGKDPWLSHPEYFSTIQTGDVDGDGRDDVIARGPYGIRTWFYNRRGTGGWESYLPAGTVDPGYPDFPTGEQQRAFGALNQLAINERVIAPGTKSVRHKWNQENPPDPDDLDDLQANLIRIANCSSDSAGKLTCTAPAGIVNGFSDADWSAVLNEIVAEAEAAKQVVLLFQDLKSMRENLFIAEGAELPAIDTALGMQAAADSPAEFSPQQLWSTIFGIAGAIAGAAQPEVGAALAVTSFIVAAIPSASPTATGSAFNTTYGNLQTGFANMVTETTKALEVQSQEVRQDGGLLGLVGQLRSGDGPWATQNLDFIGMESAANLGFATWVYQNLVPTLYDRYEISRCITQNAGENITLYCNPPSGRAVIYQSADHESFTTIAAPYRGEDGGVPCAYTSGFLSGTWNCNWTLPPDDLQQRVWGPLDDPSLGGACDYQPGRSTTAWTFKCPAGVDVGSSIGQNSWGFNIRWGSPKPFGPNGRGDEESATATAATAQAQSQPPVVLGRKRYGRRPAVRGHVLLRGETILPREMRLAGASVTVRRLLFETRGRGELTRPRGGRAPRRLTLRRTSSGTYTATTRRKPRVRVTLRRIGSGAPSRPLARRPGRPEGRTLLTLEAMTAARGRPRARRFRPTAFRTPQACHALPARIAIKTPRLRLESRVSISDGHARRRVVLTHWMRCQRDARGNVHRLRYVRVRDHRFRPGLAVTLRGPRRVTPGSTASYIARVRNTRRRTRDPMVSSLWDVNVRDRARTTRIHRLRRGRSRTVTFTRRIPQAARGIFCPVVVATAPGARSARARVCSRVRTASQPPFTG
jgi:hypothetical protein